jgi:hypothetical protein
LGRKEEMVLVGARKGRLQKRKPRAWSKAKASKFVTVLAETCNVRQACRESGVSLSVAYRRRKIDAAFRASWLESLGIAYQQLELELLDRAFNGVEKLVTRRDGSEERMRDYSNQLGLQLLKMHRDTAIEASTELPPSDVEEIREHLLSKIKRLKQRREAKTAAQA